MTRALCALAAAAALAVAAAPAASAGHPKAIIYNGHAGLGAVHGINTAGGWDPTLRVAPARGAQVIASLGVKYTA